MTGDGPMTLHEVLRGYAELVRFYQPILRGDESPRQYKVEAAHGLQSVLDASLRALNVVEVQRELEQTQRIVGRMRSDLPDMFEGDDDR
jgi:hypothetical protein